MAEMNKTIAAKTDGNGYFHLSSEIDPDYPDWFPDQNVKLWATLIEPDHTVVYGTLDIDAADGTPSNMEKRFKMPSNQEIALGSWDLSMGSNIIVVQGRTQPKVANGTVRFKVIART